MPKYFVLLETTGNQAFIFATNKRRENVGASYLVSQVGKWAKKEADDLQATVVVAVSGKAILLTESREVAEKLVQNVTLQALREAPGLDLRGAVMDFDGTAKGFEIAEPQAHDKLTQLRAVVPGPESRFLRIPVVEDCKSSPYPASELVDEGTKQEPRSCVSVAKRKVASRSIGEICRSVGDPDVKLDQLIKRLDAADWVAVIHADGNGVGKAFLQLNRRLGGSLDERTQRLKACSDALDLANRSAFEEALLQLGDDPLLLPLILGGDDLTILCDGRLAFRFVKAYLSAFETETKKTEALQTLFDGKGATSRAGIAVVKPHYPFHAAYELAERLMDSVKQVVKANSEDMPCSAFDWHILYDSTASSLKQLRDHWSHGTKQIHGRPYVVSANRDGHSDWIKSHHVETLEDLTESLKKPNEDGDPMLPRGILHQLREGLLISPEEANARLKMVRQRYPELKKFSPNGSLFTDGVSRLMDALDWFELDRPSTREEVSHG